MSTTEQILKSINEDKDEVLVENNAQTIYDHIAALEKERNSHEKRWFWELLQNAKDSVDEGQKVSVDVSLKNDVLTFRHTGNPFQRKEILHLIFHGSSKKKEEGKVGRFGTGFMTTHLLSKKVRIKGQLIEGGFFDFILDRNATDYLDQKKSLDDSFLRFTQSITQENIFKDEFKTEFIYNLLDAEIEVGQKGLELLSIISPVVLAFNPKIKSIVKDGESIINEEQTRVAFKGKTLVKNKISTAGVGVEYVYTHTLEHLDISIAIPIEVINGKLFSKDIAETYPKLFFDFPLFGTEKLGIPFIINSLNFDPRKERDGVYLTTAKEPAVIENKTIVHKALDGYLEIVEYFGAEKIQSIHNLFAFKIPFEYSWLDAEWYNSLLKSAVKSLLKVDGVYIIKNQEKVVTNLSETKLPYDDASALDEFYTVLKDLYGDMVLEFEEYKSWIPIVDRFAEILSQPIDLFDFIITKEKICKAIEITGSIERFTKDYWSSSKKITPIQWIDSFIQSFSIEELQKYTISYGIIPNQNDLFVKKTADSPKVDGAIDEDLKIIAKDYGWDIKSELINKNVNVGNEIFELLTENKVLQILENINRKVEPSELNERSKRAFVKHLKWLVDKQDESKIKEIHVYVSDGKETDIGYETRTLFIDFHKRLLAPISFWSTNFSIYKDLVRQKLILHEDYSRELAEKEINYLSELKILLAKPLVYRTKNATKTDLKYVLSNSESISPLCDEKGELRPFEIETSDIPYLVTTDENILAKTGGSFRAAKSLLKFIMLQVLEEDKLFNKRGVIGGLDYSKSIWVSRLRETQWVPVKSIEDDNASLKPEKPSTSNLGGLLKGEDDLLALLNNEKAAIFLNLLGISVADLIRNTIPDSEQKLQWDLAFTKLLTNKKISPELAREMLEDPGLQEVYKNKQAEKERIKANQQIGQLFEKIFREIFESEEYKNDGFRIKRVPFGSDFGIVFDNDIVDEKGYEVLFEIKGVLIELKATGKEYAEMTPTQANKATENTDVKYVLSVLPLDNYPINEENVRLHTKFITNIGESLNQKHNEYEEYTATKNLVAQDNDNVRLHIEDGKIRYQIKSDLWEADNAKTFIEFIDWIKSGSI